MPTKNSENKQQGYTVQDDALRCPKCQTVLSMRRVVIQQENAPFIPIAELSACARCNYLAGGRLINNAARRGISITQVARCFRATHGGNTFTEHELKNGIRQVAEPVNYNPNLTTEQQFTEQEDVF